MIYFFILILFAYLIGSIPTGYIFGRALKGIDIREHGSGNLGATNVFRVIGKVPGICVFIIDFVKGMLVVVLVPVILQRFSPALSQKISGFFCIFLGLSVIAGHIWTIFLKFKGGKGVATTAGVIAGLAPWLFLTCFGVWIVVFMIWRYVSLASISAAVVMPILALFSGKRMEFSIFCIILCLVAVYSHMSNIKRLIKGTENKILPRKIKKS